MMSDAFRSSDSPEKDEPNEKNTIVFKLHARCEKGGSRIKGTTQCPITEKYFSSYDKRFFYLKLFLRMQS